MTISVIIPALNEARCIIRTLENVHSRMPDEVFVVDGGSTDGTREMARDVVGKRSGTDVICAPRGRATQMNAGAAEASGDVLLFLHADTRLPPRGIERIREEMEDPHATGGAFALNFDRASPLLRFYAACTRLPLPHICFGDRGLFVRRDAFEAVGGFPEIPIFEDLEMARALHRRDGFRFLSLAVTTSARRFERNGRLRQQLRNTLLYAGYVLGWPPERLAAYYAYPSSTSARCLGR